MITRSASSSLTAPAIHVCLAAMQSGATSLLTDLLKAVSRSFYLTLRVMPSAVRPQIGLAYLLARTTDTIADTELVPVTQRLLALRELRERIAGTRTQPVDFGALAASQPKQPGGGTNAERVLLERAEEAIGLLASCSAHDRKLIRDVLATITSGQELDLQRFGDARPDHIVALPFDQDS
jgi:farnesyl-diphosphate farnesyltransferase